MSYDPNNPRPIYANDSFQRHAYSGQYRVSIYFPENSPFTKQSFKDECDINRIMARYQATGILPETAEKLPQYIDCSGYDYQEMANFVADAKKTFMELPSGLRSRFNNDPGAFLSFASDERNRDELEALGFMKPREQWVSVNAPPPASDAPSSPPA